MFLSVSHPDSLSGPSGGDVYVVDVVEAVTANLSGRTTQAVEKPSSRAGEILLEAFRCQNDQVSISPN
jgi:hypothetical protein